MESIIISIILFLITIVGIFVITSIVNIPQDPPTVGLMTFLGRFTGKEKGSGYRIVWGRPLIFNYVEIDVRTINHDFCPQTLLTPGDSANIEVKGSVTIAPASGYYDEDTGRSFLTNFVRNDKMPGVRSILENTVASRVREFFQSSHEGPKTWKDALECQDEAVFAILRTLIGDSLLGDHRDFLLEMERQSGITLPDLLRAHFGHGTDAIRQKGNTFIISLSANDRTRLSNAFTETMRLINEARQGRSRGLVVRDLGIVITKFTLDRITPVGEVAKTAERIAVESLEREAEKIEITNVKERIEELTAAYIQNGMDPKDAVVEARDTVMIERKKITRTQEQKTYGLDSNTASKLVDGMLPGILSAILNRNGGNNP
jgi:hypothetical protein